MASVMKQQLMNETRENQGVPDYECTSSSRVLSILFRKLRVIRLSGCSLLLATRILRSARIAFVEKMTGHLVLSRD